MDGSASPQQKPAESNTPPVRVRIELLRLDGGTQVRAAINETIVQEYREAMQTGVNFPPVVAFFDGQVYWLADGYHRTRAALASGRDEVEADLRQGTREDAVWYACAANQAHELRRSNADKRKAVEVALRSPKAQALSDRAIAEHCGVSNTFVGEVRRTLQLSSVDSCPRRGRDGKVRTTSAAKRSEAAKARVERRQESVAVLPSAPPSATPPQAAPPPPLALSLFGSDPSAEAGMPARSRRRMPLRRVLGAVLMLSPEERRALGRALKWHIEGDGGVSESQLPPTCGGGRGSGCR
jgi:ParB-like chromosome segregation protein Spo0J